MQDPETFFDKQPRLLPFLAILGGVMAGAILGLIVLPSLAWSIPTDLDRSKFIFRTIRQIKTDKLPRPNAYIFGNSVTMNGVNADLVESHSSGVDVAYNFSSTGQSPSEALLLLDHISARPGDWIIIGVTGPDLSRDLWMPGDVWNTYALAGMTPSTSSKQHFSQTYPKSLSIWNQSEIELRFNSRWALAQLPDTLLRQLVRKDLKVSEATTSLTYPAPYTENLPSNKVLALLENYDNDVLGQPFRPGPGLLTINTICERAIAMKARSMVVLLPIHPARVKRLGNDWTNSFKLSLRSRFGLPQGTILLDLSFSQPEDDFIDVVHPDGDAAQAISKAIRDALIQAH